MRGEERLFEVLSAGGDALSVENQWRRKGMGSLWRVVV